MDFRTDPSMMDVTSFDPEVLNANMMNTVNLNQYSDDIHMDMGDVSAVPFNTVEGMGDPIPESEHSLIANDSMSVSGIGAGPLPTGFGVQAGIGSTLTEFTKRRNWSQRVIEEIKDLLYILTPDARFLYLSPSTKLLTGHEPTDLIGKFIHDFIHMDDSSLFLREFNESIATGHALRMFYRLRSKEGKFIIFECHGHPHLTNDVSHLELTGGPRNNAGFCAGFFMMARPYPTKNAVLLDSFLEHKLENERLQARINALRREEAEEAEAQARHYQKKATGAGSLTPSASGFDLTTNNGLTAGGESPSMSSERQSSDFSAMPPPAKPTISNMNLTKEALDEANAYARPDSITDKMARYEGSSHVDSIEMLTGLRYREGERALGISTGGSSPALIRGDAGIDIPADKTDPRYSASYLDKKPKKVKSADEYVCTDCGTLDSPEWRKGPNGPKTLCNACGLRWAKKEKKRNGSMSGNTGGNTVLSGTVTSGSSGHGNTGMIGNGSTSNVTITQQNSIPGLPKGDSQESL